MGEVYLMSDLLKIRSLCLSGALRWTFHIMVRILQRGIDIDDICNVLFKGEIIEEYPNDYPYPSCLLMGISIGKKWLHVVCGVGDDELWLITAYYPNISEWKSDYKTRRGTMS